MEKYEDDPDENSKDTPVSFLSPLPQHPPVLNAADANRKMSDEAAPAEIAIRLARIEAGMAMALNGIREIQGMIRRITP